MFNRKSRPALCAIILCVLFGAVCSAFGPAAVFAGEDGEVGSVELIENAGLYDGHRVTYSGEIVGDILYRGDHAWIVVNDDDYGNMHLRRYGELKGGNTGLCIYCRRDMLSDVSVIGSYTASGDKLKVEGVFYRASREHGGDMMIEADRVTVVKKGHEISTNRFGSEPFVALALLLASLTLGYAWWRRSKESSE